MPDSAPTLTALHTAAFELIADALNSPSADWTKPSAEAQRDALMRSRTRAVRILTSFLSGCTDASEARYALEKFQTRIAELPALYATDRNEPATPDFSDCIVCAPDACCAPVPGVHTSCPGPAAGATAVAR